MARLLRVISLSLVSGALAAGLAIGEAEARTKKTCDQRLGRCAERCVNSIPDSGSKREGYLERCLQRTCNHQYSQCIASLPAGSPKNTAGADSGPLPTSPLKKKRPGSIAPAVDADPGASSARRATCSRKTASGKCLH